MTKKLILLQGIPGSGKSTRANEISHERKAAIFSTDDFWLWGPGNTGKPNEYTFDPSRLGEAHRWNQQQVAKGMIESDISPGWYTTIIIDNTNIKKAHVQPYLDLAKKYGYEVEVERVECDPQVAYERGTHGVPLEVVQRMAREMEDLL